MVFVTCFLKWACFSTSGRPSIASITSETFLQFDSCLYTFEFHFQIDCVSDYVGFTMKV